MLGREKGMTMKPCQQMEYQIKIIFKEKSWGKCAAKASHRAPYNFGK